jgi:hypothetical protein
MPADSRSAESSAGKGGRLQAAAGQPGHLTRCADLEAGDGGRRFGGVAAIFRLLTAKFM